MQDLPKLTITALLERSFKNFAGLPAIAFAGEKPDTFSTLKENVEKVSRKLLNDGIKKGDKVAILGENSPEWVTVYLGVLFAGGVAVPILPDFPDEDVRHILREAEAKAIFVGDRQKAAVDEMQAGAPQHIYTLENLDSFYSVDIQSDKKFPEAAPEDLAAIIYTSGTTGHSKGVMLTHGNIASDVVNSIKKFPIDSNDRFLSILPLSHTFEATGGLLCPLAVGTGIFYMKGKPTPQKLLAGMSQVKPTGVLTVPLVVDKIYRKRIMPKINGSPVTRTLYKTPVFRKVLNKAAGKKLVESLGGELRFFMFGGAALNEDVETFLREAGISYSTGYGMTETSPILTINPFGKVKVGSCGQPIPGIEMKIHEPDPETGLGEIIVKGPIVMQGYYNNPEETKKTLIDGWLRTGDLGYFDFEGYLFIKGRSKNVIIGASGENIYPELVEQLLITHPVIQEAIVYLENDKLTAKVYPDHDVLAEDPQIQKSNESERSELIKKFLEEARKEINGQLPVFSAINQILEYPEPFEKTPTNKVKRYLYI